VHDNFAIVIAFAVTNQSRYHLNLCSKRVKHALNCIDNVLRDIRLSRTQSATHKHEIANQISSFRQLSVQQIDDIIRHTFNECIDNTHILAKARVSA
jgi:hypothetical protein